MGIHPAYHSRGEYTIKPSEVFLLILHAAEGKICSKALAQRRGYLLDSYLGLGLGYRPHYFGPFSDELDNAIGRCNALGFVERKNLVGYGSSARRYDFALTPDGEKVVEDIISRKNAESSKILNLLGKMVGGGACCREISKCVWLRGLVAYG
jgi:hypothetical protein